MFHIVEKMANCISCVNMHFLFDHSYLFQSQGVTLCTRLYSRPDHACTSRIDPGSCGAPARRHGFLPSLHSNPKGKLGDSLPCTQYLSSSTSDVMSNAYFVSPPQRCGAIPIYNRLDSQLLSHLGACLVLLMMWFVGLGSRVCT